MDNLLTLDAIPKRDPRTGAVLWYTNPGGKKKHAQPPALKRYWAAVKAATRGHKAGAKKNPWEQLHYGKRAHATVAYRDSKTGKWTVTAGKGAKPRAAANPGMAVLNPGGLMVVHKLVKAGKKSGHNPPRSSAPGTVGGFFKGLFTFRAAAHAATAITGAVVDRQLVPRVVEMLPSWLDRIKTGPVYYLTRGAFAAVPALLALVFKARRFLPWALMYGFGGALSIGISLIESLLNRKLGLPTLGELGGETLEASGDPEGLFAGYRNSGGGLMGYRGNMGDVRDGDGLNGYRGNGLNDMEDADLADLEPAY